MQAIEIISLDDTNLQGDPATNGKITRLIKEECFKHGLVLENCGRDGSILKFLPALTIEENLLIEAINILDEVLMNVTRGEIND